MKGRSWIALLVFLECALVACDSKINIDSPFEKYFLKYIGTDGSQAGVDLVSDVDNNLYVLGNSTSTTKDQQLYVVKTNPKGEVIWEQILGDNGFEGGVDIELMSDGNVIIVANRTDAATSDLSYVVYKINAADGSVIGTPIIGGTPTTSDYAASITPLADGGIIVASYSIIGGVKETYVYRYDQNFVLIPSFFWQVKFSFASSDLVPVKVIQVEPNLFYTFCYTNANTDGNTINDYNFHVIATDNLNTLITQFSMPGPAPDSNERLTSVQAVPTLSGSGFVLAGYTANPTQGTQELYVVRMVQDIRAVSPTSPSGYLQSPPKAITSGLSQVNSLPASIWPSTGSGFIVLGAQDSEGSQDIFLTKVDNGLSAAWDHPFVFGGIGVDVPGAVIETADGRIAFCGTMVLGAINGQSKIALIKLSPEGLFGE